MIQETLVLVKPDGVQRGLTGEILRRIERKGYRILDLKMLTPCRELLSAHYAEHEGKVFFEPLLEFMSSGPVVVVRVQVTALSRVFECLRVSLIRHARRRELSAAILGATGA